MHAGSIEEDLRRLPDGEKSARDAMEEAAAILSHAARRRMDPSIPFEEVLRLS